MARLRRRPTFITPAPVGPTSIAFPAPQMADNTAVGGAVATASASGGNGNPANYGWTLTATDSGRFAIDATTGVVTVAATLSGLAGTNRSITIQVNDRGILYSQSFTIAVYALVATTIGQMFLTNNSGGTLSSQNINFGLPIKKGDLDITTSKLRLELSDGTVVPSQVDGYSQWPDGSIAMCCVAARPTSLANGANTINIKVEAGVPSNTLPGGKTIAQLKAAILAHFDGNSGRPGGGDLKIAITNLKDFNGALQGTTGAFTQKLSDALGFATADVPVLSGGTVASVAIADAGSTAYGTAPSVTIIGDGTGATFTATLDGSSHVSALTRIAAGSAYTWATAFIDAATGYCEVTRKGSLYIEFKCEGFFKDGTSGSAHAYLRCRWYIGAHLDSSSGAVLAVRYVPRILQGAVTPTTGQTRYVYNAVLQDGNAATIQDFTTSSTFVDANVSTSTGQIAITGHPYNTNDPVWLTTTGTLPTGWSAFPQLFWVHVADANHITLHQSSAVAFSGAAVIKPSAASGGGTHTITRAINHPAFTRWDAVGGDGEWNWTQSQPTQVDVSHDPVYLVRSRVFPPYDTSIVPTQTTPTTNVGTGGASTTLDVYVPGSPGARTLSALDATGAHAQLGWITWAQVKHLLLQNAAWLRATRVEARRIGGQVMTFHDAANLRVPNLLNQSLPGLTQRTACGIVNGGGITTATGGTNALPFNGNGVDGTHMGDWAAPVYWITGDESLLDSAIDLSQLPLWYLNTGTFPTSSPLDQQTTARNRHGGDGIFYYATAGLWSNYRSVGWTLRSLGTAYISCRRDRAEKIYLRKVLESNGDFYKKFHDFYNATGNYGTVGGFFGTWGGATAGVTNTANSGISTVFFDYYVTIGFLTAYKVTEYANLKVMRDHMAKRPLWQSPANLNDPVLAQTQHVLVRPKNATDNAAGDWITTLADFGVAEPGNTNNSGVQFNVDGTCSRIGGVSPYGFTFGNGTKVKLTRTEYGSVGQTPPTGVSYDTWYTVINYVSISNFKLSTDGVNPITWTGSTTNGCIASYHYSSTQAPSTHTFATVTADYYMPACMGLCGYCNIEGDLAGDYGPAYDALLAGFVFNPGFAYSDNPVWKLAKTLP